MNIWRKLGLAGLAAGALAIGAQRVDAACIDTGDNTVANAGECLFASGGNVDAPCRLAVSVDIDGAGGQPLDPNKIECPDGQACDADGSVNGSCQFRVGACVNLPVAGCSADTATDPLVTKPSDKYANDAIKRASSLYNKRALQEALDDLLPNGTEACTDADLPFKVDLKTKGGVCNSPAGLACLGDMGCDDYCMPVFKKNKANVAFEVSDSTFGASVKFKLTCLPATGAFSNGAQAAIAGAPDLIGGPLAMGKPGDYVIRNGNVRAVVRAPGRQHSFMLLNGGQIIDADIVRDDPADDRDSWQGMQPLVNISSSQATTNVDVDNDGSDGQPAIIHSSGPDDLFDVIMPNVLVLGGNALTSVPRFATDVDLPVSLTTDQILSPYSNYVQVATEVTNSGVTQLKYYVGDYLNPGGQLEPFGPGQGFGETQLRNVVLAGNPGQPLDYMAFQGRLDAAGVTYGVVFPATNASKTTTYKTGVFATSGVFAWLNNQDLFNTLLKPQNDKPDGGFVIPGSGSNTLRRWFVIGQTVNDVTKARMEIYGEAKSALQGVVTVGGVPAAAAHVTLVNDNVNDLCPNPQPDNCVNIYTSTLTDDHGVYRMYAPPGLYRVTVRKAGAPYVASDPEPVQTPVELKNKKTTIANVDLPATGTITVNVENELGDPIAGKVSIVGVPASADPLNDEYLLPTTIYTGRFFGYDFEEKGDVFGLADARFADASGTTGAFNLQPGSYHVVVSHGYEYDAYDQAITVVAGANPDVNATVHHVVDTTGFVSIDTHVHMINSPDSTISLNRRITSMIAEGVDFFVNTDHDFVHDLSDDIAAMGVGSLVGNAPSVETTTSHYGHFNIWPLTNVDGADIDGGAIDWSAHLGTGTGYPSGVFYDSTPGEIFAAGQAYSGTQVVQINHFNSGTLGHFNALGIDTEAEPPTTSNAVYRCDAGANITMPCRVRICIAGINDGNTCTSDGDCTGGSCAAAMACPGGTCVAGGNLSQYLRLPPATSNLYDDNYTALEVWIEAGRGQTALLLGDNMADWFNLLNQGDFKAGTADSDTHSQIAVQAGGPRTFVASSIEAPGSIVPEEIATNVNAMRAIGSNGPFMRVELENGSAATASHALGDSRTVNFTAGPLANNINIHIEAPTWAEYDTIDIYRNSTPTCISEWTFFGVVNPSKCSTVTPQQTLTKALVADSTHFTVSTPVGVSGFGTRQVTDLTVPVTITADTWVVVVVRGTDGVSRPLFPMEPQDLDDSVNTTLSDLTDGNATPPPWNSGEQGVLALAYSNPLFFDDGDGDCEFGSMPYPTCPGL